MANGKKPDYRVFVSRPGSEEGKSFYTEVGAAWLAKGGAISIKLHALPTDGSLVAFENKDEPSSGA